MAKGRRVPDEIKQEAVRLVEAGMTQAEAAKKLGIGFATVNEAVRMANPNPQKRSTPPRRPPKIHIPLLIPGRVYTLQIREADGEGPGKYARVAEVPMRFLEKYPYHALFEEVHGLYRQSILYWDLERMLAAYL